MGKYTMTLYTLKKEEIICQTKREENDHASQTKL